MGRDECEWDGMRAEQDGTRGEWDSTSGEWDGMSANGTESAPIDPSSHGAFVEILVSIHR